MRMNLASQQPGYAKVSFPKFTMKEVAEKGALSVYDGLGAGCTRQIFYATSRFGLFEVFRDKIQEVRGSLGPAERLVAGLTSGACAAMISCPAEVSLVRMSNDSTLPADQRRNYSSVYNAFTRIARDEGVATFWRGCAPFVQRAMLVGIVQVGTFDQNKELYDRYAGLKRGTYPNVFAAAFTSGLLYSIITMPFESAKNRMAFQKPDANGVLPYRSTFQVRPSLIRPPFFSIFPRNFSSSSLGRALESSRRENGQNLGEKSAQTPLQKTVLMHASAHLADHRRCDLEGRRSFAVEWLRALLRALRRPHGEHVYLRGDAARRLPEFPPINRIGSTKHAN